ncbi:iron chelate uptake ABC transporter family permease subunit [Moraxella nasibovis]|uniref:ABC transporter permease n=1 Tax=Moraxella nasibovis TaxID=2904120 RepID=UPI00240F3985|nr:iron chelate uptake ABC transporter family permease subunit [Moraxella nasibovis]WFF38757.1 iron chelate uptake ABC transporter family permease subunit [Moraxella nasibovis]
MSTSTAQTVFWRLPMVVNIGAMLILLVLIAVSISVGVANFSWARLLDDADGSLQLLLTSRLPRTLALMLTGASMAIAGMMMQVVLKNRFVEPSMVGATQSAVLGILLTSLYLPTLPLLGKMGVATVMAFLGMAVFMQLIKRLPATDFLIIPLVGIVFGGIIDSATLFIAYQTEMVQMLSVWRFGDFSSVLAGRYETLWLVGGLSALAYIMADRLTIIGLGDGIAKNLGVNKEAVMWLAIGMVAMISSVVVVTVGAISFVGLVVPNIVSRLVGDRLRVSLPAVAILGSSCVLFCDIIGRVIRYPFEIPVYVVFGVLGSALFLWLLSRAK